MGFDEFLLQLQGDTCPLAQLKEPSLATMGVVTHPGVGTAHEDPDQHAALTAARALVCRLLTRVSHTGLVIAAGIRKTLAARLAQRWFDDGFIAIGCDGSRVECPRTAELEQRLGRANKDRAAPSIWVTALVLLRSGVPWAWRIGKGTASERSHLLPMVEVLPPQALLVAEAGYLGFDVAKQLVRKQISFLIRMSSNVTLYTRQQVAMESFQEGLVYHFPAQRQQQPPLLLRLIRVRSKHKKNDVWLLTNVLKSQRLSVASAAAF